MDGGGAVRSAQEVFGQRLSGCADARLAGLVGDLVRAVHGVVRKHRVTRAEMRAVVRFATEVGLASDEKRQEWVLLSDALGLTDAVERLAAERPEGATPQTLLGPFYRPGAPRKAQGDTLSLDGIGQPLRFEATIADLGGAPLAGAEIDVWHANADGAFENQKPDTQPEFNLRGRLRTDTAGRATFRTIRPGGYSLPDDGPVAALLRLLGLGLMRPAHIQFRISAPGFQTLVTHVFDRRDPHIDADPLFCVSPALLADFGDRAAPEATVRFTFTLAPCGAGPAQT